MNDYMRTVRLLSDLLDNRFNILGFRFGLDPILGLIPGLGDAITVLFSVYILWVGWKMNIDQKDMTQMVLNVVLDVVIGSIPVVGDVADFFYKANAKNLEILKKYERNVIEGDVIEE